MSGGNQQKVIIAKWLATNPQILLLDESRIGLFVMLSAVSTLGGAFIGGKLSDRTGRKKVLISTQTVSALLVGCCGFLEAGRIIPWLLIASGVFRGAVRPVTAAIVADVTGGEKRQKAYSLLYFGTNIGVAVGPMIAGFLFNNYLKWIFFGDALTTFASVILILLFVPETLPSEIEIAQAAEANPSGEKPEEGSSLKAFLKRPILIVFALLVLAANFMYAQHSFSIPLQLQLFFERDSARLFGYIMSFNAAVVLAFTTLILMISAKSKPLINIGVGVLFYSLGFGMLAFITRFPLFIVSTFFWTIGEIIIMTNYQVFVAAHTPLNHRGRFNGIMHLITGTGFITGPFISGFLVQRFGVVKIWPLVGILGVLIAFLFYLLFFYEKRFSLDRPRQG